MAPVVISPHRVAGSVPHRHFTTTKTLLENLSTVPISDKRPLRSRPGESSPLSLGRHPGPRRAGVSASYHLGLIVKRFGSVSQRRCLHCHLPHLLLLLQCKYTRSPPSTRHPWSILSTSSSKNSARVPTDVSSLPNIIDPERVVRSGKPPTPTPGVP